MFCWRCAGKKKKQPPKGRTMAVRKSLTKGECHGKKREESMASRLLALAGVLQEMELPIVDFPCCLLAGNRKKNQGLRAMDRRPFARNGLLGWAPQWRKSGAGKRFITLAIPSDNFVGGRFGSMVVIFLTMLQILGQRTWVWYPLPLPPIRRCVSTLMSPKLLF